MIKKKNDIKPPISPNKSKKVYVSRAFTYKVDDVPKLMLLENILTSLRLLYYDKSCILAISKWTNSSSLGIPKLITVLISSSILSFLILYFY